MLVTTRHLRWPRVSLSVAICNRYYLGYPEFPDHTVCGSLVQSDAARHFLLRVRLMSMTPARARLRRSRYKWEWWRASEGFVHTPAPIRGLYSLVSPAPNSKLILVRRMQTLVDHGNRRWGQPCRCNRGVDVDHRLTWDAARRPHPGVRRRQRRPEIL
jgi:hypothetical protein